jgi:hypothetical protein
MSASEDWHCKYCGIEGTRERIREEGSHHRTECPRYRPSRFAFFDPGFCALLEQARRRGGYYYTPQGQHYRGLPKTW